MPLGAVERVGEQRGHAIGRELADPVEVVLLGPPAAAQRELARRAGLEEARGRHEVPNVDVLAREHVKRGGEQVRPVGRVLLGLGCPGENEASHAP